MGYKKLVSAQDKRQVSPMVTWMGASKGFGKGEPFALDLILIYNLTSKSRCIFRPQERMPANRFKQLSRREQSEVFVVD